RHGRRRGSLGRSAFVQNALQALHPQIRAEIREEFRTGAFEEGVSFYSPDGY
nr:hypothetical protein [Tanacetum cinerariifolium]